MTDTNCCLALQAEVARLQAELALRTSHKEDNAVLKLALVEESGYLKRAEAEVARLTQEQANAIVALKKAHTFIEYARYELQPGLATVGDQFPRQQDADVVMALIAAALASLPQEER
jgi:hypothetical protein